MSTRSGTKFKAPGPSARDLRLAKKNKRANEAAAAMNKKRKKAPKNNEESTAVAASVPAPVVKKKKKKKKKHKKHKKALTVVKTFPFGIDQVLVDSFNNFFTECCLSKSNGPALLVGDVQKEYKKWCTDKKRAYCPERTSARWNVAPFVINGIKKDKCPPFRLLMFGKLGRLPTTSEGVFSTTNTKWRRHKKNSPGHPIYKGLAWKDDFIPSVKYIQPNKSKSKKV